MTALATPYERGVALQDVREALEVLDEAAQLSVLMQLVAELARRQQAPALFLALVHQAVRERVGVA